MPKLSVIIPLYNKEESVERCVNSVLTQDFTDYELIIVNDGSTDKSADIIKQKYSDARIRLFNIDNRGVSSARNLGLKEATGEFIIFIDADDYISPQYFNHIINASNEHEADIYIWGITKEDIDGKCTKIVPSAKGVYHHDEFIHELISEQYGPNRGIMGYISNKMIRRDIIEANHIRFDVHKTLMEDYDFYLSYYQYVEKAFFLDESGYHYVWHTPSTELLRTYVNYASLIDTHRRCIMLIDKLSANSGKDYRKILKSIGNLSLAMFLEMHPITLQNVCKRLSEIQQRPYCIKALQIINTNKRTLCKWIIGGKKRSIYIYLKFWKLYLKSRRLKA